MELKLTTKRALEYEAKTGLDIIEKLQEIAEAGSIKIKDILDLFAAMGENYTAEVFDAWDATFVDKASAIIEAIVFYAQGNIAGK